MKGKIFFEIIKNKRIDLDITQKDLAQKINVPVSTLKALETGRSLTNMETLQKICVELDLNLSDIYIPNFRAAKIISIINNKGGVGKTSVTASLSVALAEKGYKVLAIDGDAQMNLTHSFGLENSKYNLGVALKNEDDILNYIQNTNYENIDFIVSDLSMSAIEMILFTKVQRESIFKNLMKNIIDKGLYDFILIDTNPTLGILNYNIINATDYIIIPITLDIFSVEGLDTLIDYIDTVKKTNSSLQIAGIVINKYDLRKKQISRSCEKIVTSVFGDKIFKTKIGIDTEIEKAQLENVPVLIQAKNSRISKQYRSLVEEVLKYV